jgi:hypothetical protein
MRVLVLLGMMLSCDAKRKICCPTMVIQLTMGDHRGSDLSLPLLRKERSPSRDFASALVLSSGCPSEFRVDQAGGWKLRLQPHKITLRRLSDQSAATDFGPLLLRFQPPGAKL